MRHLPNIITASRILFALGLIWLEPMSAAFLIVHALGSASDVADGYVARRWNLQGPAGAVFDSLADLLYVLVLIVVMIPHLVWPTWIIVWMAAIVAIRFVAVGVGLRRFRTLVFLHTWANKAAGASILGVPFLLIAFPTLPVMVLVLALATMSAVEELMIIATAAELDRDVTSIFAGTAAPRQA